MPGPLVADFGEKAIANYAEKHGLDPASVTLKMVGDSEEGFMVAFGHAELGASSAISKGFSRSLECHANAEWKEVARYTPPDKLKKLKAAWAIKRNFDFMKEFKEKEIYHDDVDKGTRIYLFLGKLEKEFGDPSDPEVKAKAWQWACGAHAQYRINPTMHPSKIVKHFRIYVHLMKTMFLVLNTVYSYR